MCRLTLLAISSFIEFAVKSFAINAEDARGFGFVAIDRVEHRLYILAFQLTQSQPSVQSFPHHPRGRELQTGNLWRQFLERNSIVAVQNYPSLNRILKLPDISGPWISQQTLH